MFKTFDHRKSYIKFVEFSFIKVLFQTFYSYFQFVDHEYD